jgi:hypothetical protein
MSRPEALNELILLICRANGALLTVGDRLARRRSDDAGRERAGRPVRHRSAGKALGATRSPAPRHRAKRSEA